MSTNEYKKQKNEYKNEYKKQKNEKTIDDTKMNKNVIQILLFLIAVVIAIVLLPTFTLAAYAAAADSAVSNETELINTVAAAPATSFIIELNDNISLAGSLVIPPGKNITLISGAGGPFVLIGANNHDTVIVDGNLTLGTSDFNGITITHNIGELGRGVFVNRCGVLIMNSGEISGNSGREGGGITVHKDGAFYMSGSSRIVNNTALADSGMCVGYGSFALSGNGSLSNNMVLGDGGGAGIFEFFVLSDNVSVSNSSMVNEGSSMFIAPTRTLNMTGGAIANYSGSGAPNIPKAPDSPSGGSGNIQSKSIEDDFKTGTNGMSLQWLLILALISAACFILYIQKIRK